MCADVSVEESVLEIEIKLRADRPEKLVDRAHALSFVCISSRTHEYNIVFDTPGQELAGRNVLLRLRRWGENCLITLKRPAPEQENYQRFKVRRETNIIVDDFDNTVVLFSTLGFTPSFRYEKYRSAYRSPEGLLLTLDETPIGCFIELEGVPDQIDRYVVALGYDSSDVICQSYRSLFFSCGRSGDMLFDR